MLINCALKKKNVDIKISDYKVEITKSLLNDKCSLLKIALLFVT